MGFFNIYNMLIKKFESFSEYNHFLNTHNDWEQINPPTHNFVEEYRYQYYNGIYISLLRLKESEHLNYYLNNGDTFYYIGQLGEKFTMLFSYEKDDYKRMMLECEYVLPFFDKKPSDSLIEDIKECFLEIDDLVEVEPKSEWGYNNSEEYGFFPPFRREDRLALSLIYMCNGAIEQDKLLEEFELVKDRLRIYNITEDRVSIKNENWRIIIEILF